MTVQITPAFVFPDRSLSATIVNAQLDAFYSAFIIAAPQLNAMAIEMNAEALVAASAQIYATQAQASAVTAQTYGVEWVSGTTYTAGQAVWSPISFRTYRRKTAGAGTTDPSIDNSKWSDIFVINRAPTPTVKTAASWDEVSDSYTIPQCPTPQFGCSWNEATDSYSPIIYSY